MTAQRKPRIGAYTEQGYPEPDIDKIRKTIQSIPDIVPNTKTAEAYTLLTQALIAHTANCRPQP